MTYCFLCQKNPLTVGLLCKKCAVLINTNKKYRIKWNKLRSKKNKKAKLFKEKLEWKKTKSQHIAERIIRKIASVYYCKIQPERIYGPYFLDIYIPKLKIAIEIDGCVHNNRIGYDDFRDRYLYSSGVGVYRFKNEEIKTHFFKEAIWNIFHLDYMGDRYQKIISKAKENHINLQGVN